MKKTHYVLSIFSRRWKRGHGLLSVFATNPGEACTLGRGIIGRRPYMVGGCTPFRLWAAEVHDTAVNEFLNKYTKI